MDYIFFRSTPRSLEDLDNLLKGMNYLARQLGEEKAKQVESSPEEFFNANKFRYYQSKAYHRAIPFSILSTLAGVFAIGGYDNSHKILRNKKPVIFAAGFCIYFVSYKFFEFRAGFRNEDWVAHNYAKYLLITRNARVKM